MTQSLNVNRMAMARLMMAQHDVAAAVAELRVAADAAAALVARDTKNMSYLEDLGAILILKGEAELVAGDLSAAAATAHEALAVAGTLSAKDSTIVAWSGLDLGGARVLQARVAAQQARSSLSLLRVLVSARAEFARLERIVEAHPHNLALASTAAEAAILAGDQLALSGQTLEAREAWGEGAKALKRALAGSATPPGKAEALIDVLVRRQESSIQGQDRFFSSITQRYNW